MAIEPRKVIVDGRQLSPAALAEHWLRERDTYTAQVGHVLTHCAAELWAALLYERNPLAYDMLGEDPTDPKLAGEVNELLAGLAKKVRKDARAT